mmetsp:Transcript_1017/g.6421  ORF Transcript_1017/g.6421 Transcript_1017/m.6421 type:complete len:252 (+) Transcript_1017:1971-2726(+)
MVSFVPLTQPMQNLDGLVNSWFRNLYRLETAFQSRVLLNVLAIFIQCSRSDALEFATSKCRLQNVCSVDGSFSCASTNQRMDFINHQYNVIILLDFIHELLQAFLEFTPILGTCNQQTHIKGNHLLSLNSFRDIPRCNTLGETFCNRCLPHTRFTNQTRVVLCSSSKNLDHTLDLLRSTNNRVQLTFLGLLRKIGAVLFQGGGLVAARLTSNPSTYSFRRFSNHTYNLRADLGWICIEVFQHTRGYSLAFS